MRDFRDAKTMAQTLRENLATKSFTISHSESLELVSRILGVADWNTLSALLQTSRHETRGLAAKRLEGALIYPAIPMRDLVPFPNATYPIFVGRRKTMQALDRAFERQREVVLAVQRQNGVDEPGLDDVYEVGVLARLIELRPLDDGTLKAVAEVHRRVVIRRFIGETGAFEAEISEVSEGPIVDTPVLIERAVKRFEAHVAEREIRVPQFALPLAQTRDPGRVADIIAGYMQLPMSEKQSLLAALDPVARLEKVDALLEAAGALSNKSE